jgi:hypothetical protein
MRERSRCRSPPSDYNWVRPHEAIGLIAPIVRFLAEPLDVRPEPNLSAAERVQIS